VLTFQYKLIFVRRINLLSELITAPAFIEAYIILAISLCL